MFELFFLTAILLDLSFGDPRWFPHPVRAIGALASLCENFSRRLLNNTVYAGTVTFLVTLATSVGFVSIVLIAVGRFSLVLQSIAATVLLYFFIAIKDLLHHSKEVYACLYPIENIEEARKAVGKIVGRDTADLKSRGICRACVETVAENMVDGITAPIFWAGAAALCSGPLPLSPIALAAIGITAYKTINTMDSMFGYKNSEYIAFGRVAAQVDDIVNFIPARLSGLCIVAAARVLKKDSGNSLKIFLRDRNNHASPNAAHSEAALAGALGIRLGGASSYFGETMEKPLIGDEKAVIGPHHILDSHRIIVVASLFFTIFLWSCMKFSAWIFSIL